MRTIIAAALLAFAPAAAAGDQTPSTHRHSAELNARGAKIMGFDQEKTTHRFLLFADGGAIVVAISDPADAANLAAIRSHLPHLATMFGAGNFAAPMLVHDANVPGATDLARLRDRIEYKYTETRDGGRVDITTTDAGAVAAVHAFLRFQITDHETGDPLSVQQRR
jgi:hypothetical protein